jgi:hypothetical protein
VTLFLIKKALWLFPGAFFLLSSCSRSCPQWYYEKTRSCDPRFNSARLTYDGLDSFDSLELEMVDSRMYVNTFSRPLRSSEVTVRVEASAYSFSGTLLEGDQRILLSDDARDFIVTNLLENHSVELIAGPYHATIGTAKFAKLFNKLNLL